MENKHSLVEDFDFKYLSDRIRSLACTKNRRNFVYLNVFEKIKMDIRGLAVADDYRDALLKAAVILDILRYDARGGRKHDDEFNYLPVLRDINDKVDDYLIHLMRRHNMRRHGEEDMTYEEWEKSSGHQIPSS